MTSALESRYDGILLLILLVLWYAQPTLLHWPIVYGLLTTNVPALAEIPTEEDATAQYLPVFASLLCKVMTIATQANLYTQAWDRCKRECPQLRTLPASLHSLSLRTHPCTHTSAHIYAHSHSRILPCTPSPPHTPMHPLTLAHSHAHLHLCTLPCIPSPPHTPPHTLSLAHSHAFTH